MRRYATELLGSLQRLETPGWEFEQIQGSHAVSIANAVPGALGRTTAERIGRFVKYPMQASTVKADVFHILDNGHANLGLALDARRTVITCHDLIPFLAQSGLLEIPMPPLHAISNPIRSLALRRAKHLIAISESTKCDLIGLLGIPEERITVVYLGLSADFFPAAGDERIAATAQVLSACNLPDNCHRILNVSSGAAYKNTRAVIRTLADVIAHRDTPTYLIRVGADFSAADKQYIAELGLQDRVRYAGFVATNADLRTYYLGADVLLFPSIWEGFGWPPVEALACGCPVVASNVASLPEAIGEAGILVDVGDQQKLVEAVLSILTQADLRTRLREAAIKQVSKFNWRTTAAQTQKIYEAVADSATIEQ